MWLTGCFSNTSAIPREDVGSVEVRRRNDVGSVEVRRKMEEGGCGRRRGS